MPSLAGERKSVQNPLVRYAVEAGWTYLTPADALALRRGAQEHRSGPDGEVGAAGDHRVDRADPDNGAMADLEPFLLVEAGVLGEERRAEGQRRRRQRHQDIDLLVRRRGGAEADHGADRGGNGTISPSAHVVLPEANVSRL